MKDKDRKKVLEALDHLELDNEAHWTEDGMPRLDVVKQLSGVEVTREELTKLAPKLIRHPSEEAQEEPSVAVSPEANVEPDVQEPLADVPNEYEPLVEDIKDEHGQSYGAMTDLPNDLAALDTEIALQEAEVNKIDKLVNDLLKHKAEVNLALDRVHVKREFVANNGKKEMTDVQAYLKKQQELRSARTEATAELVAKAEELGLTVLVK